MPSKFIEQEEEDWEVKVHSCCTWNALTFCFSLNLALSKETVNSNKTVNAFWKDAMRHTIHVVFPANEFYVRTDYLSQMFENLPYP